MPQKKLGVLVLVAVMCGGVIKYLGVKARSRLHTMRHARG